MRCTNTVLWLYDSHGDLTLLGLGACPQRMERADRTPHAETDSARHLLYLQHVVREEDLHRLVSRL